MCKVSQQLKLCTCRTDIYELDHYWIFHRFIKGKKNIVIGQAMLPASIDPADDTFNQSLLLNLLNEGDIFDVEIKPSAKDRLEISLLIGPGKEDRITYGFECKQDKWVATEYDPLMWMWNHDEEKSGEIKNALQ